MDYPRYLKENVLRSFKASPVTLLIGPRQSGKTTLMRKMAEDLKMDYVTFDGLKQLAAAQSDPEGFINGLSHPTIIDEVQRVPEIALPIKARVDEKRVFGFFGLTGSANPLVAPKLNDSLAGRMFILKMWPLSTGEILGTRSTILDLLFDPNTSFQEGISLDRKTLVQMLCQGGYPNVISLDESTRNLWFDNLLTTILERDVRDIEHVARPRDIAKILNILTTRTANLCNLSEISRTASMPYTTLTNYMAILEALFLIIRQPPWHINRTKRLIKMPKLYFVDTGLLISQLGISSATLLEQGRLLGQILENFVFMELMKLTSWAASPILLYHYRTQTGIEVDIILENRAGQVVAIEVKASETITAEDWKGIDTLGQELGDKMIRGIIFYPGKTVVPFKKDRIALPLSLLWQCERK